VLQRLQGHESCDLVSDVAQPIVALIGSFMGLSPEDDRVWANLMNAILGAGDPDMRVAGRLDL
jgi:cholest-4-en-3-one 26-monooxygenase